MKTINYDFSKLQSCMFSIKSNGSNSTNLNELKRQLNLFFKDAQCKDVIYTNNTDKLFFGMCVMPVLSSTDAVDVMLNNKSIRITEYYLEMDSKLFDVGLSAQELTAILLHEVGHMVNDTTPVNKTRAALDIYLEKNNKTLVIKDSIHEKELFKYAIKDTMRKLSSIFYCKDEEIIADEFVVMCGYGPALESGYKKIVKSSGLLSRGVDNKLNVLEWTLRLYTELGLKRVYATKIMNKGKSLTGSKLEKRELEIVGKSLDKMEYTVAQESAIIMEGLKHTSLFAGIRKDGLKNLEDDLYEYNIRVKTVSQEDEALLLLRQINMRMGIIDDYMTNENIDEKEKERWYKLYNKYNILRETLSKKAIYDKKAYGLFVDYNTYFDNNR